MDVEMKPDYVSFLDILPPVEFGCIYGSSLHPNNSDKTSMVDFILGVADTQQWHAENLKLNRNHYASWMVHLGEAQLITWVADHIGVRVHFNPFVSYRDRMFKYGVVSMKDLIQDIQGWESFYLSGRLQKPVNVIVDKLEIENVNCVNLKAAASTALLLLPSKFSEEELYAKICSLSYMGDLRMLFAEDKNKVKKIVQGQFNLFQKMYAPFLEEFAAHDLLRISSSADQKVNLIQDCGLAMTCSLVSSLPLPLRYHMGMKLGEEKAIDESGRAIQNLAIKSKEQAADCMRKILRRKVMVSSARQAVAGLLTSGAVHGVKYVGKKMKKFLIEYGPGINHPIPSTRYLSPIDRWRLTENKEIGEVIYSKSFFLVKQSVEFWVGGMGLEGETNDGDSHPRSYWRFSKQDFFPEKSFENWSFYLSALSQTRARFKDRLLNRSEEATELIDLRKQSENTMKRCLNWWDLTWFGFGAVIGTGIFVLTGQEAHKHAGPAIILSYVASGISAMLSVFCYTEFAVEIPVAGGSFAYLRVELGDLAAFITAGNILLESIVGSAAVARGWTSYFTTLLDRHPDSLRIHTDLHHDFNLLDPIAAGVLLVAAMIAITSAKKTSYLNWIASAVNTVVILFVIVAGFAHAETSNLQPFLPFGAKGVLQAAAVVYFAYGGFDNIATMAEETKDPSRDIPLGLLGSMSLITVIYCLMALSLTMMQNYTNLDTNAAYSVAFQSVGMKWAKYLVALGALKGMTTVLLVGALGQARYTTHIARSHMIPPWFALVHPKTGTPIYATLLITMPSAIVAFFSSLDVLSSLLSVSTLFIFMMMAVALLVRRYYMRGVTPKANLMKLVGFLLLIVASSIGTSAFWGMKPDGWIGYAITLPVWFLATLGIAVMLPQERRAKVWGVPMVPWLPSLSIGINLFLMGSLSGKTFMRFGICTVIMLLYYVFLGVHATYDMAHQRHMESPKIDDEQLKSSA